MKRLLILIALFISSMMMVTNAANNENETSKAKDSITTQMKENENTAVISTSSKAVTPEKAKRTSTNTYHSHFPFGDNNGSIIAIVSVVMVFGMPIFIIFIIFFFIHKSDAKKAEVAKAAIQSGQPVPDYLLDKKIIEKRDPEYAYKQGIQTALTGIGLAFFLGMIISKEFASIGILVTFVGLGKMLANRPSSKKRNDDQNIMQL